MALRPKNNLPATDRKAKQKAASDDALMREVDEAVRQDRYADFGRRYGVLVIAVLVIGLAAFGGFLWYRSHRNAVAERHSETIVTALDQVGSQGAKASAALQPLSTADDGGAGAVATMIQAGIAMKNDDATKAASLFERVAQDDDAPGPLRDLATIRAVTAKYDTMKPAEIVNRLKPIAVPGNAFFGSAGELLAMTYLDQGKKPEAGRLFAQIAKDDDAPESLRGRARQMAGMLGVDAIEDVDAVVARARANEAARGAPAPAAPAAQ